MKDKGEVDYLLSFTAGKEFEATTDGARTPTCTCTSMTSPATKSARTIRPVRMFGENHPGEGRKVQVRRQERRGRQHGDFRDKGRRVVTC